jgi:hypothetical protein
MWTRTADGGANDTPSVALLNAFHVASFAFVALDGEHAADPWNATGSFSTTSSAGPHHLAALTTDEADCFLLGFAYNQDAPHADEPNSWTLEDSSSTSGVLKVYSRQVAAAATYGGSQGADNSYTLAYGREPLNATVAVRPAVVNTPPTITDPSSSASHTLHVAEGATAVTTVQASGTPTPTYGITGGANAADFGINATTGELTLNSAAAYGAPKVVEVTASNGESPDDAITLTVVVDPVYSGPAPDAPLDDAAYFYRPLADYVASNTQYPNHGTRDEPLVLGDDYTADAQDPDWSDAGGLGGHLVYTNAGDSYAWASAPEAIVDAASFTFAVRLRYDDSGTIGSFFNVIKDIVGDEKTIFGHRQSDNTYEIRIWDGTTNAQVGAISTTTTSTSRTDTVVGTYDGATRELTLYVNGVAEDSDTAANARRLVGADYYLEWPVGVGLAAPTLSPNAKFFRMAFWDRCLSGAEVAALETNVQWTTDGEGGGGLSIPVAVHHYRRRRA